MDNGKMIGLQTYHTLRYLHSDYSLQNRFYSVTSPEAIKKLIWERIKPTISTEQEKVAFMKGIKLCDFRAIFDWVVDKRGYYITLNNLVIELLRTLPTGRTGEVGAQISHQTVI